MRIIRVFNNNIVLTITDDKKEAIAQGSGIGFQKKPGDLVDEAKIEKMYHILDEQRSKFEELFEEVPIEYFQIAEQFAHLASKQMKVDSLDQIVLALSDHLYFAVQRELNRMWVPNLMSDEIRILYQDEYQLGLVALDMVEKKLGVKLHQDEACYIALHLVNAIVNLGNEKITTILKMSQGILDLIRVNFNIALESESLDSSRLMTHVKFLAQRLIRRDDTPLTDVDELYEVLAKKDHRLIGCVDQIDFFLQSKYQVSLSKQEKVYLMIHLLKIV